MTTAVTNTNTDIFTNSKQAQKKNRSGKKSNNIIEVDDVVVRTSVDRFTVVSSEIKKLDQEKKTLESGIKDYAENIFIDQFLDNDGLPDTLKLAGDTGIVSYIISDKSSQYGIKPEALAQLSEIIGQDNMDNVVETSTTFRFNNDVISKPGVMENLSKAIMHLKTLGLLDEDDIDNLIVKESVTKFKKDAIKNLPKYTGGTKEMLRSSVHASGSAIVISLKSEPKTV